MTLLVADHGVWVLGVLCFLSCLILPIPASLAMLAAGGFAATGQMGVGSVAASAYAGAILGDQAGYGLGRLGGAPLVDGLAGRRGRAVARAQDFLHRHGALAVFLTRWLFAPLGPWVNFACGAAEMGWGRFSVPAAGGKAVWVGVYVGAGYAFGGNIAAAVGVLGPGLTILAGAVLVVSLAIWLRPLVRARQ